jgi:hypothetical protein
MRVRLAFLALVSAFPFALAVACGGSETPAKTGGEEKPSGDDTTESSGSSESSGASTAKTSETSTSSSTPDEGPSAGDYASMPIVTCGKNKCAQGQICTTIACKPSEPKCAEQKVCATPLNYKP